MNKTPTIIIATLTAVGGLLAYAAYFDYKRRNDVEFRKKLRKDKKRVDKNASQKELESTQISAEELRAALEQVRLETVPQAAEAKEHYFMTQVSIGERLAVQGPEYCLPAAISFYRALRVYPSPVELIVIYQKTMPESVFKIVMDLTNLDVKDRVEGYYDIFPPKDMNVSVENRDTTDADGNKVRRKVLVVNKDTPAGEVIYKETPVVASLDLDLEGQSTHCTHCLRHIQRETAIRPDSDRLGSAYCSEDCQVISDAQYQSLLFGLNPVLPPEMMGAPVPAKEVEVRDKAQKAFIDHLKHIRKAVPFLVAKFIARQVANETLRVILGTTTTAAGAENGNYTLNDHIERLRYLEVSPSEEELKLLREVFQAALPGLEQSITDDRHATLLGKMLYNSYGICIDGGRDDRPLPTERPEDVEKTRTPFGTSRQIGAGYYTVSSYIAHSCNPNARPSFSDGTSELHLIANTPLTKGEEITVAYVDVTQHPDETAAEARRRRRMELARGWRFACSCQRCTLEGAEKKDGTDSDVPSQKDESKIEPSVSRLDEGNQLATA